MPTWDDVDHDFGHYQPPDAALDQLAAHEAARFDPDTADWTQPAARREDAP